MSIVGIGIGANIDPALHMPAAVEALTNTWPALRCSALYASAPQETVVDQPEFWNAVVIGDIHDTVAAIMDVLRDIEKKHHRSRAVRLGPRTLDLDLLFYGTTIMPSSDSWHQAATAMRTDAIIVPHPRMHTRRFVLEPLADMGYGGLQFPVHECTIDTLLATVRAQPCRRIAEPGWEHRDAATLVYSSR